MKYNMNDDKSNENVFGFVDIDISSIIPKDQQRIECWEWRNNNTAFCLFQEDSGWNEMVTDEDGDVVPAWRASFEPRFPDIDPEYDKTDALYRMMSWVVSTRTDRATGAPLSEEQYYKTRDTNWVKDKVYYSNTEGAIAPIQEKGDIISHNSSVGIDRNLFYTKMGATSYDELVGSYAFSFNQETNTWTLYKDEEVARENIDQIGLYGVSISDSTITTFAFDYKIVGEGWSTNLYDKFTEDTEEYRLSKFKNEFKDYFELDAMTFYYVFTETFLMIDNRAKNMFLTTFDGLHWFPIPYDMDSAIGINNSGQLVFDYNLEDTDFADSAGTLIYDGINKLYDGTKVYTGKLNGSIFTTDDGKEIPFTSSNVYNGQDSVLWINFRKCFQKEIRENYQSLRSTHNDFSSESISNMFSKHQEAWAEIIWNIDQRIKYLLPFFGGADYLKMAQGNKEAQRDFWLFNAFKYRDSKYQTGDAKENSILLRLYNKGEIHVKPYSHIYARVQFGNAKDETHRTWRNEEVIFNTEGIAAVNDLETYIYSADRISDLGDLSDFKIGLCDFSSASKLSRIVLGKDEEGYANGNLKSLTLGKNGLLNEINISNCYNLKGAIDASGCYGLEKFKARGSKITSVNFSNGGRLKEIILPETTSNLTLKNQTEIESLAIDSYENLSTLHLENTSLLPIEEFILNSPKLERVRLYNVEWEATNEETLYEVIEKLKTCKGINATGQDQEKASVHAKVHIKQISDSFLEGLNSIFPELIVVVNGKAKYYIKYVDIDNTELYHYIAEEGTKAIDPVAENLIERPSREATEDTIYYYEGWRNLPTNISQSYVIVAKYNYEYRVRFFSDETAQEPSNTQWVYNDQAAIEPVAAGLMETPIKMPTPEFYYEFKDWGVDLKSIKSPLELYPHFNEFKNLYIVKIFGGQKQLGEDQILEYNSIIKLPTENIYNYYYDENTQEYNYFTIYEHSGWDINNDGIDDGNNLRVMPVQYTTEPIIVRALFSAENFITEDSWETIANACKDGSYKIKYPLGTQKEITFLYAGSTYSSMAELVDYDYDRLTEPLDNKTHASLTFIIRDPFSAQTIRNNPLFTWESPSGEIKGNLAGGFLNTNIFNNISNIQYLDSELEKNIKTVYKKYDRGPLSTEQQDEYYPSEIISIRNWTPSATELDVIPFNMIEGIATKEEANQGGDGTKGAYVWFTDNMSRKKTLDNDPVSYWTRTYYPNTGWRLFGVGINGEIANEDSDTGLLSFKSHGIVFGFCI